MDKIILDATCGSRSIWFDKHNPKTLYVDKRCETLSRIWSGSERTCDVSPDIVVVVTALPFEDNSFWHVVFDPTHLLHIGETAWLRKKYGKLPDDWRPLIRDGFKECMRVLKPNGTLIFKWCEFDIPTREIIKAIGVEPLYGHRSGKKSQTHWLAFVKEE